MILAPSCYPAVMPEHATRLAEAVDALEGDLLFVVTGAGVSATSGIPTFRGSDADAVWKVSDVEMATFEYFQRDPVGQWLWYLKRFESVETARPNPAHEALVDLEGWQTGRGCRFQLVTQNIDTLHETAGARQLIKIHGTSARLRCSRPGCGLGSPRGSIRRDSLDVGAFRDNPSRDTLPRCAECGAPLRAHVLFFDEHYQDHDDYRFDEAMELAQKAGLFLFIGTSFSVGITDLFLSIAADNRTPTFSVDPVGSPPPYFPVTHLPAPAEELLPELTAALSQGAQRP